VDSTAFIDSVATRLGTSSEQATALTRATLTPARPGTRRPARYDGPGGG
jgi:hypothetical protein